MERGKIIQLFPRHYGPRCEALDLHFPGVYRITGCSWSMVGNDLVPNERWPMTLYGLAEDPDFRQIANAVFTPINHLEPGIDDGWIIVRHHQSDDQMTGYIEGVMDCSNGLSENTPHTKYRTPNGLFSIHYRKHPRPGCKNRLLIFEATVPADNIIGEDTWSHIVRSNGEVSLDGGMLWPHEDDED